MNASEEAPAHAARLARRVVALVLLAITVVVVGAVLRGIIGTLFALPSATEPPHHPLHPPLSACAEDLEALEASFRSDLAAHFGSADAEPREWRTLIEPHERRRRDIVEQCGLDEDDPRPGGRALAVAASELEEAFSAAGLLWARHRADGAVRARAARDAIVEARRRIDPPPRKTTDAP